MAASLLESFDAPPAPTADAQAYEQGFADGHAAAEQACAAEQARLSEELIQNVKDLEFKFAEAHGDFAKAVGPVFAAICDKIFPAIIDQLYSFRVADILRDAALARMSENIALCVHPSQADAVQAAVAEISPAVVTLADATLGPHAVLLRQAEVSEIFDPDALLADIAKVLDAIARPQERTKTHG